MRLALIAGVVGVLGFAVPAAATPLVWDFQGAVVSSQIAAIPVGTAVSLDWAADPSTANACAATDPAVGIYSGQALTEHIGGMTYQISGILTVGTNLSRGCSGAADQTAELRLVGWSGPNAAEGALVTNWPPPSGPALLWSNPLATGSYPFTPPASAILQGPLFAEGQAGVTSVVQPVAVPEPATLSLLLSGGLLLRRRIMNA